MTTIHIPVLVNEVLEYLAPKEGGVYVDATIGPGGHAVEICKRIGKTGTLIGIDRDAAAIAIAKEQLKSVQTKVIFVQQNYRHLTEILNEQGYPQVDGMIFDLGVSSLQLDDA
ncbi:MAG: 16S rRNA (cytosine(1402)-N(4))-methyltransferase, partial [bacterium]|nr:16S rRNA (cytosine(1402)-N(4))-methyltransferase [bacterium]